MRSIAIFSSRFLKVNSTSLSRGYHLNKIRSMASNTVSNLSPLRVALCQLSVGADKDANIAHAAEVIQTASSAQLVVISDIALFLIIN